MKIGIITFHASLNCGSMLQAFALQTVLIEQYGADVEIINYSNFGQRSYYANWDIFPKPSIQKNNIKAIPHYSEINAMRQDYQSFENKYFKLSSPLLKHYSDLIGIDEKYDIVVAGGDQIWNVRCRDADKAYFLSFVTHARKVAFSPSLGAKDINKFAFNKKMYADLLKKFDYLSVREDNGQKWLRELTGINVPIVADPTLLFTGEQWSEKLKIDLIEEDFILYYSFSYSNEYNNTILAQVSQKYGMPVYMIDGKQWHINKLSKYGIKLWRKSGPEGFLSLMKSAKLVLVQSFHGIVFSALFHKTFWSLRNAKIANADDDRAQVILRQTGLQKRAICYDELPEVDLMQPIEYKKVDQHIESMKSKAFQYIDSFMRGKHEE